MGSCSFECLPNRYDIDDDLGSEPSNGCEYACVVESDEVCDYFDNDCNGYVDDGFEQPCI